MGVLERRKRKEAPLERSSGYFGVLLGFFSVFFFFFCMSPARFTCLVLVKLELP